jgi:hypothetical protein
MIVYSAAVAALTGTSGLDYPRIGYHSWLDGVDPNNPSYDASAITVSSEDVNGPRDALLRPDTADYWLPTALPATWQMDFGQAISVTYVGIAGHNFGDTFGNVGVQIDSDPTMPEPHLLLTGTVGNYMAQPSPAGVTAIVGDIDIRVQVAMDDWTPAASSMLVCRDDNAARRIFRFRVITTGVLQLQWTADGVTLITAASTVPAGVVDGTKKWARVTLDVNNGAGGNDVKFYTSDDGSVWTQLGATVTTAGVTSLFASATPPIAVGRLQEGDTQYMAGKIFAISIQSSIGGPTVAFFGGASHITDGATTSTDFASGGTWTVTTTGFARLNNNYFAGSATAPGNNRPLMLLDSLKVGRYLRLTQGGDAPSRIAVLRAGLITTMERKPTGGWSPITMAYSDQLMQSMSRGGQFLGQSFRRKGAASTVSFKHLSAAFVRNTFQGFSNHARSKPYFFAWEPLAYPNEVGYVWSGKAIVPRYSGFSDLMDVSWDMQGVDA